jgi:tagatose-6-phosphate ketose/aldose isomerase
VDPLSELLALPAAERRQRGIAHTPAEIAQQPETWLNTLASMQPRLPEIRDFLEAAGVSTKDRGPRPRVFLIGAGTSDYIGRCLHHLLRRQWQCEVTPVSSTSLLSDFPEWLISGDPYLWISFSRSGDSPEGVAVLERALAERPAIRHIVVTCNNKGRMVQSIRGNANSLGVVLDDATNDRGLAMTSSFSNMVLAGQALAHSWSFERFEPIVAMIVEAGRAFLPVAAQTAKDLAGRGYRRACFVGSAALAGVANESALKLLELTAGKVNTMAESTLGLRHGPMAALDRESLLVSFLSGSGPRNRYELDLLREVSARHLARTRIAVSARGCAPLPPDIADGLVAPQQHWPVPDLYRPVLDVIFGQLLGLFSSLATGCQPDSPSPDGVISRVVQNVGIY